jgi:hypothetical protein
MKVARLAAAAPIALAHARGERVGNWLALLALIASSIVLSPADAARGSPVARHPCDTTACGGLAR